MTTEQFRALSPEQVHSFYMLLRTEIENSEDPDATLSAYIESAYPPSFPFIPYVGIPNYHGMFVGIEPDGHTHT